MSIVEDLVKIEIEDILEQHGEWLKGIDYLEMRAYELGQLELLKRLTEEVGAFQKYREGLEEACGKYRDLLEGVLG